MLTSPPTKNAHALCAVHVGGRKKVCARVGGGGGGGGALESLFQTPIPSGLTCQGSPMGQRGAPSQLNGGTQG